MGSIREIKYLPRTNRQKSNLSETMPYWNLAIGECSGKRNICDHHFAKLIIPKLDCSKRLSYVIARLRRGHFVGMKMSPEHISWSYPICRNYPQTELTPECIYDCQAIFASLSRLNATPRVIIYSPITPHLTALIEIVYCSI